jgi:hypothetical protein
MQLVQAFCQLELHPFHPLLPTTTGIDQRGAPRPRDGDGNRSFVVDIGAFER